MPYFVAERYQPARERAAAYAELERIRAAAVALGRIRCLQTLYLPADELCLYVFESDSDAAVAELSRLAAIEVDRIRPAEVSV